jgi:hypothetical protein
VHRNEEEGKGKGEGGFTSTGADELRASSKSAIRFSLRGVERERSFWVEQGRERRPFFLGLGRRGCSCCGSWCARMVGDVGARLLGGPGAQGAGGERGRGKSWLGRARGKVPGGPRALGLRLGRDGTKPAHDERERRRGGSQAGPRQGSQPKRGGLGFSYFLFNSNLS